MTCASLLSDLAFFSGAICEHRFIYKKLDKCNVFVVARFFQFLDNVKDKYLMGRELECS